MSVGPLDFRSYKFVILLLISKENLVLFAVFSQFFSNPYKINNFSYFNFLLVLCDCQFYRLYMNTFSKHLIQTCVSKNHRVEEGLPLRCAGEKRKKPEDAVTQKLEMRTKNCLACLNNF